MGGTWNIHFVAYELRSQISWSWSGLLFNFNKYGQVVLHSNWTLLQAHQPNALSLPLFPVSIHTWCCHDFTLYPFSLHSTIFYIVLIFFNLNALHLIFIGTPWNWNYCSHFTDEVTEVETHQIKICFQAYIASHWKGGDLKSDWLLNILPHSGNVHKR